MTFTVYAMVVLGCLLTGYMLGVSDGKDEGYLKGIADEYKAGQER
jgi:hypothetical protein